MDIRVIALGGLIGGTLACVTAADAAVLRVPQQYGTIQAAVDAAQEGDTVRVAAGTYTEHVLISGKAITLVGAGAAQTTIDAAHDGRPITVSTTGTGQVTVSGFTLTNGQPSFDHSVGTNEGGGFYAAQANVALRNSVLTNNLGCLGTSVATFEATITMTRNRIENNPATDHCGQQSVVIRLHQGAESTISGNVIQNHNVTGLLLQGAGKVTVSNNIFRNNVADFGLEQGGLMSLYTEVTLTNNLFKGNYGIAVGGAYVSESETGAPVRLTGNSFVANSSGWGGSSLLLTSVSPTGVVEDTIVKSNQFDDSTDRPSVYCFSMVPIDDSNVFAAGRDAGVGGGCIPAP